MDFEHLVDYAKLSSIFVKPTDCTAAPPTQQHEENILS